MKTQYFNSNLIPPEYRNEAKWPESFTCSFIEPGLISYEDMDAGKVLVAKQALDKMAQTFVGKPVVNLMHKDLTPKDFKDKADGVVTKVYYNEADGWFYCDFMVWDEETKKNCTGGKFSVSCAYIPTETTLEGGMHNNIKYDQEVLNGEYTHLAIVKNPRYNKARILLNSIGGTTMFKLWPFGKKEAPAGIKHNELDTESALVDVDGAQVPLKVLIECYKAEQAEKAGPGQAPLNEPKPLEIGDESMIPVEDKEVKLKELVHSYKNKMAKENAAADEEKKKKEEAEAAEKAKKEKENAESPEAKKEREEAEAKAKAESEKKNAEDAEKKKKEDEEKAEKEKKNAVHFQTLKNAADKRTNIESPDVHTRESKREAGKSRYGSTVTQK